jgi:hypothetical protein
MCGDQGGVHVQDQPPGQDLPGDGQPREPGRGPLDQLPHVRPGFCPGLRDPLQHRRAAGQVQGAPYRRPAWRRPQHGSQVRQHRDVAHGRGSERDRRRHRHQHDPAVQDRRLPARCSAALSPAVGPAWSAALRSRIAPACPTRPVPPSVTFRAWSHGVCCMTKSAPIWKLQVWLPRNLPESGRSLPLNPQARTQPRRQAPRTHQVRRTHPPLPGMEPQNTSSKAMQKSKASNSPLTLNAGG